MAILMQVGDGIIRENGEEENKWSLKIVTLQI
jgi:hypothetical protein